MLLCEERGGKRKTRTRLRGDCNTVRKKWWCRLRPSSEVGDRGCILEAAPADLFPGEKRNDFIITGLAIWVNCAIHPQMKEPKQ
jgi:hypothetical protein